MIYTKNRVVAPFEIDLLNHVNNVVYVQWVNDVAKEHWFDVVPKDQKDTYFWVIIRHEIDYRQSALLGDIITLKTWVKECKGVKSNRIVEIYNKDTLLAKSETTWCLYTTATKKITRITNEIENWLKEN